MMVEKVTTSSTGTNTWRSLLFIFVIGGCLGLLGGFFKIPAGGILGALFLLALFGAYNNVMSSSRGLMSGLVAGGFIGLVVGGIGYLLGTIPDNFGDIALFGLVRGMLVGAAIGLITHAQPDEGDSRWIMLFLIGGSIVVGAFLGASVGLVTGILLGSINYAWWGIFIALILGLIIGAYLGSYFRARRAVLYGALLFGGTAVASTFIQGALHSLLIGMLAGALTPMLLVAGIGFSGGLASRGLKAGIEEAIEAPAEMIQQGAVAFLAPAMLIGIIVGAAASGEAGLIALTVTMAVIGMMLGVIIEIERGQARRLTVRRLIEMIMLGSDRWPIEEMVARISGANRRTAVAGAFLGLALGGAGSLVGVLLGQQLALWIKTLL